MVTHQWTFLVNIGYIHTFLILPNSSLIRMNLWREPIVLRKVSMAFSFYLKNDNLSAEHCFVYSRYRGNRYFSDVIKAPPTGKEWMCIFNNPVCSFCLDQSKNPPT